NGWVSVGEVDLLIAPKTMDVIIVGIPELAKFGALPARVFDEPEFALAPVQQVTAIRDYHDRVQGSEEDGDMLDGDLLDELPISKEIRGIETDEETVEGAVNNMFH